MRNIHYTSAIDSSLYVQVYIKPHIVYAISRFKFMTKLAQFKQPIRHAKI